MRRRGLFYTGRDRDVYEPSPFREETNAREGIVLHRKR